MLLASVSMCRLRFFSNSSSGTTLRSGPRQGDRARSSRSSSEDVEARDRRVGAADTSRIAARSSSAAASSAAPSASPCRPRNVSAVTSAVPSRTGGSPRAPRPERTTATATVGRFPQRAARTGIPDESLPSANGGGEKGGAARGAAARASSRRLREDLDDGTPRGNEGPRASVADVGAVEGEEQRHVPCARATDRRRRGRIP